MKYGQITKALWKAGLATEVAGAGAEERPEDAVHQEGAEVEQEEVPEEAPKS